MGGARPASLKVGSTLPSPTVDGIFYDESPAGFNAGQAPQSLDVHIRSRLALWSAGETGMEREGTGR